MSAVIELDEISKSYRIGMGKKFRALDAVSFNVDVGITGLLGPNGAGKSTLIKILLGLLRANSGTGRLLDFTLGKENRKIRAHVGYMPEDDCYLFGLTGIETVQVSARLSNLPRIEGLRRAHEILDFCGMGQERYRTVETYSTGMRQKLRFAQAIVHDPPLLILDEPTSGLDPEERIIMLNRIKLLAEKHGKAVLICTHILPDVQAICDAAVILAEGKVKVAERLSVLNRPPKPALRVSYLEGEDRLADRLETEGIQVQRIEENVVLLHGDEKHLAHIVWTTVQGTDIIIRSMTPAKNSLEQVFIEAVQGATSDRS